MSDALDLDQKYRPRRLEEVVGQPEAVAVLRGFGTKVPRCLLLHGPSGTGKTTLGRIVADILGVGERDLAEENCAAVASPIELGRQIRENMSVSAWKPGGLRMWILDEIQAFSKSQQAQEALLKVLEDPPPHVRFVLCTTDPQKLKPTIRGRCTQVALRSLRDDEVRDLVRSIAKKEKIALTPEVEEAIVSGAGGGARDAVKLLEKVAGLDPKDASAAVGRIGLQRAAYDLVKVLMPWKGNPDWTQVAAVLTDLKEEDPEGLRQMVLASARTSMLKNGNKGPGPLAYKVIRALEDPLYDRNSGHAILAAACFKVCFVA